MPRPAPLDPATHPRPEDHRHVPPDRRTFLRHLTGALAVTAGSPAALLAARAPADAMRPTLPPGLPADESFWEAVKAQFPVRPGLIMMNAANLCPSPFPVRDAVTALTREVDADASFQNRARFRELHDEALEALGRYVGADPDELVVTRNTTEGNNIVVTGLDVGPGERVVLWDQNHPSNDQAWDVRARREGFEVVRVATPGRPGSSDELVQPFLDALDGRTRVLAFSHVSNVSGVALPVRELCAAARERGAVTLVDGAQTFGSMHLDLHALGCDFFTASAHKWFMGPKEGGMLYVRRERLSGTWPAVVGVGFDANGAASLRLGTLGQRDDAAVAAMGTAVAFHQRIGAAGVESRVRELTTALMEGLHQRIPGVTFHTPSDPALRLGVVVFDMPGLADPAAGFETLYREHGVAGASHGRGHPFRGIRLCPHVYNTLEDVERAGEAVAALV